MKRVFKKEHHRVDEREYGGWDVEMQDLEKGCSSTRGMITKYTSAKVSENQTNQRQDRTCFLSFFASLNLLTLS